MMTNYDYSRCILVHVRCILPWTSMSLANHPKISIPFWRRGVNTKYACRRRINVYRISLWADRVSHVWVAKGVVLGLVETLLRGFCIGWPRSVATPLLLRWAMAMACQRRISTRGNILAPFFWYQKPVVKKNRDIPMPMHSTTTRLLYSTSKYKVQGIRRGRMTYCYYQGKPTPTVVPLLTCLLPVLL